MPREWTPEDVDRYVLGRMTGEECDAFEVAFFEDPDLHEQVSVALSLRRGLKANHAKGGRPGSGLLAVVASPAWSLTATAAAAALGILALGQVFVGPRLVDFGGAEAVPPIRRVIRLDADGLRAADGVAAAPALVFPKAPTGVVLLEISLPPAAPELQGGLVSVHLEATAGQRFVGDALVQNDFALLLVPAGALPEGTYTLTVRDPAGAQLMRREVEVRAMRATQHRSGIEAPHALRRTLRMSRPGADVPRRRRPARG